MVLPLDLLRGGFSQTDRQSEGNRTIGEQRLLLDPVPNHSTTSGTLMRRVAEGTLELRFHCSELITWETFRETSVHLESPTDLPLHTLGPLIIPHTTALLQFGRTAADELAVLVT